MVLYVGDDWAETHHDVHLMTAAGESLASRRVPEGLAGIAALHALIAEHAATPDEVVIGSETDRGLWVAALRAAGYRVYAINPRSVARYRERHHVGGAKSDAGDAKVLADLVRTDRHQHRPVAGDSDAVAAVRILARTQQQLIWDRTRLTNRLRSGLREYFPAALVAFPDLAHGDAVGVLARAPDPHVAAQLTTPQIRAALRRGGRQRHLDRRAAEIRAALRTPQLEAPPALRRACAASTRATVGQLEAITRQLADVEAELTTHFATHPDADLYRSLPGLGVVLGARVLGEFGDDPTHYASAKARRNYAGTSPVTVASGRRRTVKARFIRNRRLAAAVDQWALCALLASPGCEAFYRERRAAGDLHHQALRVLGNRLVGYLHGCLRTRTGYREATAWDHRQHHEPLAA